MKQHLTTFLRWATWSRFEFIRNTAWALLKPKGQAFFPSNSSVRILVGGDVNFDTEVRMIYYYGYIGADLLKEEVIKPSLIIRVVRKFWRAFCRYLLSPQFFNNIGSNIGKFYFPELLVQKPENEKRRFLSSTYLRTKKFNVDLSNGNSKYTYPFEKISPLLKSKDLVLVNLETPLTTYRRAHGLFLSDPIYAQAMKDAGISIVNLANNHIFDGGEIGFSDTICHLKAAGISYTGVGENFQDARSGRLIELNDIKLIFLGYTQFCNLRFASVAKEYSGILPMDRQLMVEDIKVARTKADFVFVSLHWGIEDQPRVHPKQIEIAHLLIDAGADCIIGHHSHVPHAIEIYKKRPILYSLGNFIFGHKDPSWSDNYLAEIIIDRRRIHGLIIYPIAGQEEEFFQPELLTGVRAHSLLQNLQMKSVIFNTEIVIQNDVGHIEII